MDSKRARCIAKRRARIVDMKKAAMHGKEISVFAHWRKWIATPGMRDIFAAGLDVFVKGALHLQGSNLKCPTRFAQVGDLAHTLYFLQNTKTHYKKYFL